MRLWFLLGYLCRQTIIKFSFCSLSIQNASKLLVLE